MFIARLWPSRECSTCRHLQRPTRPGSNSQVMGRQTGPTSKKTRATGEMSGRGRREEGDSATTGPLADVRAHLRMSTSSSSGSGDGALLHFPLCHLSSEGSIDEPAVATAVVAATIRICVFVESSRVCRETLLGFSAKKAFAESLDKDITLGKSECLL
jgi:hypothetical protein